MSVHVLVITEGLPYPMDVRLRAQVAALLGAGYDVTVISPTGYGYDQLEETVRGAQVRRFTRSEGRGTLSYLREYTDALVGIVPLAWRIHREHPVDLVFVCNPPDLLVVGAMPLIRRGAKLVFDARELSPDLFEAKFRRRGLVHHLLVAGERFAVSRADAVIVVSESFMDVLQVRSGVPRDRIFLVGNGPDPDRIYPVHPRPALRRGRKHLVLWLGVMSRQDGLEHLLEAADEIVNRTGRSDVAFAIVGPGDAHEALRVDVRRRHLEEAVLIGDVIDDADVRSYLSTADLCVGVDECVGMNDLTVMRKVLEYMAVGRPVVQFPLKEMRRVCGDSTVYARNADARDLAEKILGLLDDPVLRRRLATRALARAHGGLMWPQQVPALLAAVSTAFAQPRASGRRRPWYRVGRSPDE